MRIVLILTCLLVTLTVNAQRMNAGISYEYFYSPSMDQLIQTYNFDRPFLDNKQPLFMNGLNTSFSIFQKREQKWKHGFYTSYTILQSFAKNENFENRFLLNLMDLGYVVRHQDTSTSCRFYSEFNITTKFSGLFRRTNGEAFIYDDRRSPSFGIGASLSWLTGYSFQMKNNSSISPTFQLSFTPYLYAPNNEAVINGTKGLVSEFSHTFFSARIGLAYRFK